MNNKLKYFLGAIISVPLLPFLYFQGKNIRKKVPKLPEAKEPKGIVNGNFNKTLNLLTIGESTIAGVGVDYHKNGFTGSLSNILSTNLKSNVNWRVYARSGYTVAQVCKKIIPKIEENSADIIVIGMGGNDAFTLNSPKNWDSAIENLINLLQNKFPGTPLFFTNMPPIKEFPAFTKPIKFVIGNLVEILGERLQTITKDKKNVFYFNEVITLENWSKKHGLPTNNSKTYFSDGVHPSKLTYKIWGEEMGNFIKWKLNK
ncbi:SGNH/GDSL hydrolase family protein [Polaribacter sp. Z014]|uniref:SGNH/GDSL hydrolase family protein n=1 Tax=unclassified Polaribacter TaxID=196858 RepID=UPI00193B350A|nr:MULTISPECIES: SGNH/GDSL hydrolase family protein [unclassified Polaribacter]MCL7763322.1 SGNH/GDSL hydrolase family protein [Polaribacter sp. Z014]QVY67266.1 SGNH/GDSL hydrolase family protein [Polaribacter sp. Q13]